jgi:hypothetical protein
MSLCNHFIGCIEGNDNICGGKVISRETAERGKVSEKLLPTLHEETKK